MKYRRMGKSGLELSVLGLGSWYTLDKKDEVENNLATMRKAYELGINFFDTANVYTSTWGSGEGEAEIMLGNALSPFPRHSYVVCTKVRGVMGFGPNRAGLSYKHIIEQCEESLRRLGMDYIDLYMCHRPHDETPLEETIRAMDHLHRQGKILYWAASNFKAWRVHKVLSMCKEMGAVPLSCLEPRYNMLFRYPELELFPATKEEGLGHVVFSPLAQGLLTGKYQPGANLPEGSRAADEKHGKYMRRLYLNELNVQRAARLTEVADEMGVEPGNLALAWILKHPQVNSAIIGAKNPQQVEQNVKAAEIELTDEVYRHLCEIFPLPRGPWLGEAEIPNDLADWQAFEAELAQRQEVEV